MAIEDTFSGAKNAFIFYQAFVNTVAKEIGRERASALETKMCETLGALQGRMAKEQAEQAGIRDLDAKAAYLICGQVHQVIGGGSGLGPVIAQGPDHAGTVAELYPGELPRRRIPLTDFAGCSPRRL